MNCSYCNQDVDNLKKHINQFHQAMESYAVEETDDYEVNVDELIKTGEPTQKLPTDKRSYETHPRTEDEQREFENGQFGGYDAEEADRFPPKEQNKNWDEDFEDIKNKYQFKEVDKPDSFFKGKGPDWCGQCGNTLPDKGTCKQCDRVGESWDFRSFNSKLEAFESLGFTQGDALAMASLNWNNISEEVQYALEVDNAEKEEKVDSSIDAFNNDGVSPNTKIDDMDNVDYNIIKESLTNRTKYECEYCNSGFRSNESLITHRNDIHAIADERILDGYDYRPSINEVENSWQCDKCGEDNYSNNDKCSKCGNNLKKKINESIASETSDGICRICGISADDHSNPNTSYRGMNGTSPPTDHYFVGTDDGVESNANEDWDVTKLDNHYLNSFRKIGEDYYECKYCGKDGFYPQEDEAEMKAHIKKHEGGEAERKKCPECGADNFAMNNKCQSCLATLTESYDGHHIYRSAERVSWAGEDGDFKEEEHPRADDGKFTSSGSGGATKQAEKPKISKKLTIVKDKIIKDIGKPKDDWENKKLMKIKNLDGYPQHSSQLKNVGVRYKAPILKAHLTDTYGDNKWSVRTDYYSMGSALRVAWKGGGKYPYGAGKIAGLYSDSGATDSMVDYFDSDNHVGSVGDDRENRHPRDPFDVVDSRERRFGHWIYTKMNEGDNWAKYTKEYGGHHINLGVTDSIAKYMFEGKSTGLDDIKFSDFDDLKKEFLELEKSEGGIGTPAETAKATTPASYEKPLSYQSKNDPREFPIDPSTGKELPVSAYNPNASKYKKPNPAKDDKEDTVRAYGLMKAQKDKLDKTQDPAKTSTLTRDGEPWQKGGEAKTDYNLEPARKKMQSDIATLNNFADYGQDTDSGKKVGLGWQEGEERWTPKTKAEQLAYGLGICPFCKDSFDNEDAYDSHISSNHPEANESSIVCPKCGSIRDKEHLGEQRFKCKDCGNEINQAEEVSYDWYNLDYYKEKWDSLSVPERESNISMSSYSVDKSYAKSKWADIPTDIQKKISYTGYSPESLANESKEELEKSNESISTEQMKVRELWEQINPTNLMGTMFEEFMGLKWSELPNEIQKEFKTQYGYEITTEVKWNYDEAQGKPCPRCGNKIIGYTDDAEPYGTICHDCGKAIYGSDD